MKKPCKRKKRTSIRFQFTLIFSTLMVGVVLFCVFINSMLLERIYEEKRVAVIKDAYDTIQYAYDNDKFADLFLVNKLNTVSKDYNVSIAVIDARWGLLYTSFNYESDMKDRLIEYYSGNEGNEGYDVIEENSIYVIRHIDDSDEKNIEMIGSFESGVYFIMRTPFASVADAARTANRFFMNIALMATLIGATIIWIVTRLLTKPIEELNEISKRMVDLDFDARYTGKSSNEIGVLGDNMNRLSESLEKSISELKTANLELKNDIEKKEQIDEMRMEFISNVSHELKTPIAVIQGYAEGLKEGIMDDPESKDYYCDVIIDESAKMNQMVRKFLTLNQLEFGGEEISLVRFDITQMISSYLSSASMLAQNGNIDIRFDDSITYNVWADEYKAEEVLTNYFSNAVNHCKVNSRGEKYIEVSVTNLGENVRVTVFNTGDNIPAESFDRLWEKFYKVDKARTREYGGSGIGLSIVKAIQDTIGKRYGVENRPDGVAFWYELDKN